MRVLHTYDASGDRQPGQTVIDASIWNDINSHTVETNTFAEDPVGPPPSSVLAGRFDVGDLYITAGASSNPVTYMAYLINPDPANPNNVLVTWQQLNPGATNINVEQLTTSTNPARITVSYSSVSPPTDFSSVNEGDLYVYVPNRRVSISGNALNTTWICIIVASVKRWVPFIGGNTIVTETDLPNTIPTGTYRKGLIFYNTTTNLLKVLTSITPGTINDTLVWTQVVNSNTPSTYSLPVPLKYGFFLPFKITTLASTPSTGTLSYTYNLKYLNDTVAVPSILFSFTVTYGNSITASAIRDTFIAAFNAAIVQLPAPPSTLAPIDTQKIVLRDGATTSPFNVALVTIAPNNNPTGTALTYSSLLNYTATGGTDPIQAIAPDIDAGVVVGCANACGNVQNISFKNSPTDVYTVSGDALVTSDSTIYFSRDSGNIPNEITFELNPNSTLIADAPNKANLQIVGNFKSLNLSSSRSKNEYIRTNKRVQGWVMGDASLPGQQQDIPYSTLTGVRFFYALFAPTTSNQLAWITNTSINNQGYIFSRFTCTLPSGQTKLFLINVVITWNAGTGKSSYREVALIKNYNGLPESVTNTIYAADVLAYDHKYPCQYLQTDIPRKISHATSNLMAIVPLTAGDYFSVTVKHDNNRSGVGPNQALSIGAITGLSGGPFDAINTRIVIHELV